MSIATSLTPDALARHAAALAAGRHDIYAAIRAAEAWPEEWCAVVVDAFGRRQYVSPTTYVTGPRFTRYRGSSRRFPSREAAIACATAFKDSRVSGRLLHGWIRAVDAELVVTRPTSKIGDQK
ncbi:hypothetical protein [Micromonospora zamorensis]|uniref:hypothetical protein n=1 Tax=Micromonospora zamorensis TaxID=709883 RepID=UPI003794B017